MDAIVEAAVFRVGDSIRVQVQLVGVRPERQLWAESYDRHLRDVLALHAKIARRIAGAVEARLLPAEAERLAGAPVVDPQAYDAWLHVSYHASRRNAGGRRECVEYSKRAAARDSTFAPAFALLAECYSNMTFLNAAPAVAMFDSTRAAARKALDLDQSLAQAPTAMAYVRAHHEWDRDGAEEDYHRALEERRTGYVPPIAIAAVYVGLGKKDEALDWLERGFDERDGGMVLLKTFSLWDPLRDKPRFRALIERMNFPRGS